MEPITKDYRKTSVPNSLLHDSILLFSTYSPDSAPIHMVANLEEGRTSDGVLFLRAFDRPTSTSIEALTNTHAYMTL